MPLIHYFDESETRERFSVVKEESVAGLMDNIRLFIFQFWQMTVGLMMIAAYFSAASTGIVATLILGVLHKLAVLYGSALMVVFERIASFRGD